MISDKAIKRFLRDGVLNYYRYMYRFQRRETQLFLHPRGRGIILHEYIKGLLFTLGQEEGLFPIPEYRFSSSSKQRIDILWANRDGDALAAFEIDQTVYPKSIRKLSYLTNDCRKFIVSSGKGVKVRSRELLAGTEIICFDLTMKALGVLDYFYKIN